MILSTDPTRSKGFTLLEVTVVMTMAATLTLGVGVLLANSQKDWNRLTGRVYGDEATDSFAIQKVFDRLCRKSSMSKYVVGEDGGSLELYYWNNASTSVTPENYGWIYLDETQVFVEYGKLLQNAWQKDPGEATTTVLLARDVASLEFIVFGTSIQMYVTYTDPDILPVACSSARRNE